MAVDSHSITKTSLPGIGGAGSAIGSAAEVGSDQLHDGERKTVTALFADIKGSTDLMEDLDPEEARAIVDPAIKLMIDALHRYDGYFVQSTGDGIFAIFGAKPHKNKSATYVVQMWPIC